VFSLSFLDVFACTLGILLFIMLLVARQLTLTFDEKAIRAAVDKHEQLQVQVREAMNKLGKAREVREARTQMDRAGGREALVRQLQVESDKIRAEKDSLVQTGGALKPGEIEQLRARQVALQQELKARFPDQRTEDTNSRSPSPFANLSPTAGTTRRPIVLLVRQQDVVDLWNLRQVVPTNDRNSHWQDMLNDFKAGQERIYPLLLVEPSSGAVMLSERVLEDLKEGGIDILSVEPLSSAWRPSVDEALRLLNQ
jgi:hypothetical protein